MRRAPEYRILGESTLAGKITKKENQESLHGGGGLSAKSWADLG